MKQTRWKQGGEGRTTRGENTKGWDGQPGEGTDNQGGGQTQGRMDT